MPRRSAETQASEEKVLSRRILVNIKRDVNTVTPRVIWAHEYAILEGIFGEGNVTEIDSDTLDEGYKEKATQELMPHNKKQDNFSRPSQSLGLGWVFIGSPEVEYSRLVECYNRHPEVPHPWVEYIYDRYAKGNFKRLLGNPTPEDLPESQLRHLLLQAGYELPIVTWESEGAERKQAEQTIREFRAMPKDKLIAMVNEMGALQ